MPIFLMFFACIALHTSYLYPAEVSTAVNAPLYIKSEEGKLPVLQVAVINRTCLVSNCLLIKTLKAINTQVKHDFAPYYGIRIKFFLADDPKKIDWETHVPLIITDYLKDSCNCLALHDIQDSANENGTPISDYILNPPKLPNGTPYVIVPMGNSSTGYGVYWASKRFAGNPAFPPGFNNVFSKAVSHEVLNLLYNYSVNKFFANLIGVQGQAPEQVNMYISEVCDPVMFSPGYTINNLYVSNFVLPSFWVPDLLVGPFDFLDTVPAPFTPYAGQLEFYKSDNQGTRLFKLVSEFSRPEHVVEIFIKTIFSCPGSNSKKQNCCRQNEKCESTPL